MVSDRDSKIWLPSSRGTVSYYPFCSLSAPLPSVSRHANRARMEALVCLTGGNREPVCVRERRLIMSTISLRDYTQPQGRKTGGEGRGISGSLHRLFFSEWGKPLQVYMASCNQSLLLKGNTQQHCCTETANTLYWHLSRSIHIVLGGWVHQLQYANAIQ